MPKMKCEACGALGRRHFMRLAPENWLFLEAKDDEDPKNTLIIAVCSKDCAGSMWKTGPGPRLDAEETLDKPEPS